eukprot:990210-Ditylum_brightwellii.AAC.1
MALSAPPEFLREEAKEFYSASPFDFCVYATSLGYLDFCVAQFTITNIRASSATWFQLHNEPIHLVVFNDNGGFSSTYSYLSTILQPFTTGAWLVILIIVIPLLGMLMVVHELGAPGSAFPRAIASITRTRMPAQSVNTDDEFYSAGS